MTLDACKALSIHQGVTGQCPPALHLLNSQFALSCATAMGHKDRGSHRAIRATGGVRNRARDLLFLEPASSK